MARSKSARKTLKAQTKSSLQFFQCQPLYKQLLSTQLPTGCSIKTTISPNKLQFEQHSYIADIKLISIEIEI